MSQFGPEDKVCHFLIGDDLLMLIYVCKYVDMKCVIVWKCYVD